jgi:hypothetical protein
MSKVRYFFDNDVIIKLSQYDLLDELYSAFKCKPSDFYMLPTYEFVTFHKDNEKALTLFNSEEAFQRSRAFFVKCSKAEIKSIEIANIILKLEQPNLDAGELVLLGCVVENDNSSMVTGDKRALFEINQLIQEQIIAPHNVRFILLEMAFNAIIEICGYDHVYNKVHALPNVDKAIANCFGRHGKATKESALEGLRSYIKDMHDKCPHVAAT